MPRGVYHDDNSLFVGRFAEQDSWVIREKFNKKYGTNVPCELDSIAAWCRRYQVEYIWSNAVHPNLPNNNWDDWHKRNIIVMEENRPWQDVGVSPYSVGYKYHGDKVFIKWETSQKDLAWIPDMIGGYNKLIFRHDMLVRAHQQKYEICGRWATVNGKSFVMSCRLSSWLQQLHAATEALEDCDFIPEGSLYSPMKYSNSFGRIALKGNKPRISGGYSLYYDSQKEWQNAPRTFIKWAEMLIGDAVVLLEAERQYADQLPLNNLGYWDAPDSLMVQCA